MKKILMSILCLSLLFNVGLRYPVYASQEVSEKNVADIQLRIRVMRGAATGAVQKQYDITDDNKSSGVIDVLYNTGTKNKIKLMVQLGSVKYVYNLGNSNEYIQFPTQLGNGSYTVSIYENTTGTKYKKIYGETSQINLVDSKIVYKNSIQLVDWEITDEAIALAQTLVSDAKNAKYLKANKLTVLDDLYKAQKTQLTEKEIIKACYDYVVKNISYDYNKIKTLNYDYIPDIDAVLEAKSGICYDYSVLLASMLRSQGIPAKLIKGYSTSTDVYHAWNEIYLTDEKRWAIVDTTFDAYMYQHNRKYDFEKALKDYNKSYEY